MKKIVKKVLIIGLTSLFLIGCNNEQAGITGDNDVNNGVENHEDEVQKNKLTLSNSYLSLKTGESYQLKVDTEEAIIFTSSNPEIATVDKNGKIKAVSKGNALIVAETETARGTCGVMIDLVDESIDIEGKTMTPYAIDLTIARETSVMQSFAIKPDGTLFIIQGYNSTPADCIVTKVKTDGTQEYMRLVEFGHGNAITVEWDDKGNDYLWIPSVGNIEGYSNGMSRVKWEADAFYQEEAGQTWKEGVFENDPNCSVDMESGRLLVCCSSDRSCYIYDLKGFLSGELTEPLHTFSLPAYNTQGQPGSSFFQGFALYGEYFYTYEGKPEGLISIHTFDLDGNWLYSRNVEGYADLEYREAESIQVCEGKIYIGIASGPSYARKANIFTFE